MPIRTKPSPAVPRVTGANAGIVAIRHRRDTNGIGIPRAGTASDICLVTVLGATTTGVRSLALTMSAEGTPLVARTPATVSNRPRTVGLVRGTTTGIVIGIVTTGGLLAGTPFATLAARTTVTATRHVPPLALIIVPARLPRRSCLLAITKTKRPTPLRAAPRGWKPPTTRNREPGHVSRMLT